MIDRSHLAALILTVLAANAYAACDASVVSVLSNNQVVLKADCGDGVTGIQWFRDNNSLTGGTDVPLGYTTAGGTGATGRDIYFTTTLYPGIHVYKATANSGAIAAGNLATVSASMPPPTIGNAPDQTATIGTSYTFSLAPYVANSHGNLTYSISGALPSGLSLNTASGVISGTPGSGAIGGTITWTAADDNGTGTPPDQIVYTVSSGTPPTAPTSVVAAAGNAQISVAFSGQSLGTGTLTNYAASCNGGAAVTGQSSPITVTGLTNGTPYTCTVTVTTSVAPPATSGPSNSVTPSASTCSGGVEWTNFNRPGLTTSGTLLGGVNQTTVSYSFVMGKTDFPTGAQILLNVSGSYSNVRDHFISSCPGDFTNPPAGATLANCRRLNAKTGTMYLGYTDDQATQNSLTCNLVPGQTYYLNMRTVYNSSQGAYLSSGYLLNTNYR